MPEEGEDKDWMFLFEEVERYRDIADIGSSVVEASALDNGERVDSLETDPKW